MTDLDAGVVDRLRQLADQATPGPWAIDESPGFEHHVRTNGTANAIPSTGEPVADTATLADAAFFAAASPDVVRQLLDDRDDLPGLRAEMQRLRGAVESAVKSLAVGDVMGLDESSSKAYRVLRAALAVPVDAGRPETCGRTEDHLAHGIPMTMQCPGVGEQVCSPDEYKHLGPWHHVQGSESLDECEACGTVIGK